MECEQLETPRIQRYSTNLLGGLRRFAAAITVLTILGHAFLGFEQSIAQPLVALATAYSVQLLLEWLTAWAQNRRPVFAGGVGDLVTFLLPAHITGLAIAMLLYYHERIWDVSFASALAISSKTLFRVPVGETTRHFFNPSNFGITMMLLLCPWVGLAIPWQFTAGLTGAGDWLFVVIILCLGSMINIRYTQRIFVVIGFLTGFVVQALVRVAVFDASLLGVFMPATGIPAWIFTFYMVPDPATTPNARWPQFLFGAAVGLVYLVLVSLHVANGLFYALTIVCAFRGLGQLIIALTTQRRFAYAATAT